MWVHARFQKTVLEFPLCSWTGLKMARKNLLNAGKGIMAIFLFDLICQLSGFQWLLEGIPQHMARDPNMQRALQWDIDLQGICPECALQKG